MSKKRFELLPFLACVAIPVVLGAAVGLLIRDSMQIYAEINRPPFAPPGWLFPIVWAILYVLMGVSLYLIYQAGGDRRSYLLFGVQLAVNLLWPFLFFVAKAFPAAFVCLLALWVLILLMIRAFYAVRPAAAYLQIPYLLWVTFAGVLNLAVAILN